MPDKYTVISSLVSDKNMTQAGLLYLCTALKKKNLDYNLIDLSGTIDYFDAPQELYSSCKSDFWLNIDLITNGTWIDSYIPNEIAFGDYVFFSALYSPDLIFHSRISYKLKELKNIKSVIGGAALTGLNQKQLKFVSNFFDYILIGYDVSNLVSEMLKLPHEKILMNYNPPNIIPDYSLLPIKNFVNVYTGHGCYYGKCRFCDYPTRSNKQRYIKPPTIVAKELYQIYLKNPLVEDIVLTQDSYTRKNLLATIDAILKLEEKIPYNLMLRAESWINEEIGHKLEKSNCTDVFMGIEALDNNILKIINKGINVNTINNSIKILSKYVDITIGFILFIPNVTKVDLNSQLNNLKLLMPYISHIEPEILTVVNGSEFQIQHKKYGIELYATKNLLNDSWCFGLSNDIPYTISDFNCIRNWCDFIDDFKKLCFDKVKKEYWEAIEYTISDFVYSDTA